ALVAIQKVIDFHLAEADRDRQAQSPCPRFNPQRDAGGARVLADRQRHGAIAYLKGSLLGSQRLPAHADRFLEKFKHRLYVADSSQELVAKPAPEGGGRSCFTWILRIRDIKDRRRRSRRTGGSCVRA